MDKSRDAFRTISEVAEWLDTPTYVLRFWESRFPQIKPVKRAGGRRYYRPEDMQLLGGIKKLLHFDGNTIKGVQNLIKENGVKFVCALSPGLDEQVVSPENDGQADTKTELENMAILKPEEPPVEEEKNTPTATPLKLTESDKTEEQPADAKPVVDPGPKISVKVHRKAKILRPETDVQAELMPVADEEIPEASITAEPETTPDETAEKAEPTKAEPTEKSVAASVDALEAEPVSESGEPPQAVQSGNVLSGPFAIRPVRTYSAQDLQEIETLYYSLKMVRNNMKRVGGTA